MKKPGKKWLMAIVLSSLSAVGMAQTPTLDPICNGSTIGNKSWNQMTPARDIPSYSSQESNVGRAIKIHVDEEHDESLNTVYIGTENSGLWKTTDFHSTADGAPHWKCITCDSRLPGVGVNDIAINPDDPSEIFIATAIGVPGETGLYKYYGAGILKTVDGGANWTETDLNFSSANHPLVTQNILYTGNTTSGKKHLIATAWGKIYRSVDDGANFYERYEVPKYGASKNHLIKDVLVHPNDPNKIFASTIMDRASDSNPEGARFLMSIDGGYNWTDETCNVTGLCNGNSSESERIDLAVSPDDPNLLLLYVQKTNGKFVYRSWNPTNASPVWDEFKISNPGAKTTSKGSWYMNDVELSRQNSDIFYIGHASVWKVDLSTATGSNPTMVAASEVRNGYAGPHPDFRDVYVRPDPVAGERIYLAHDGGVAYFVLDGPSLAIHPKNGSGLDIRQFFGLGASGKLGFEGGGAQDLGLIYRFRDWKLQKIGDGYDLEVDEENEEFYVGSNDEVYNYNIVGESINYSEDYFDKGRDFPQEIASNGRLYYTYHKSSGQNVTNPGNWLQYAEPGQTNSTRVYPKIDAQSVGSMAVAPTNSDVVYIGDMKPENGNKQLWRYEETPTGWDTVDLSGKLRNAAHLSPYQIWAGFSALAVSKDDENAIWVGLNQNFVSGSKKVLYHSDVNDANTDWEDINNGLPDFPVNHLEVDLVTGSMYAATDVGVYFNSDPTSDQSTWHCYNLDLPVVKVTELEIDYCTRKLYCSTYGRGLWSVDLAEDHQQWQGLTTITSNTTWSTDREQLTDVFVASGSVLTITGTVKMARGRRISIERGAQVIVDGGTVTALCDRWDGFRVWGDPCQPQTAVHQGRLNLINGAVISHANDAVSTTRIKPNGSVDWAYSGGAILFISNATFRDNRRAIEFMRYPSVSPNCFQGTYPNRNASRIMSSTFETTGYLPGQNSDAQFSSNPSQAMITMWDVNQVLIYNCTFRNTQPQLFPFEYLPNSKGAGISTMGASYLVHYSTFENLSYGIVDNNTANYTKGTRAENNTFNDVEHAISIRGGRGDEMRNNTIQYSPSAWIDPGAFDRCGIELYRSNYFNVWENTVKETPGSIFFGKLRGALIMNTGNYVSLGTGDIHNNEFEELDMGIAFEYDNAYVRVRCNEFNDNEWTDWMSNEFSPGGVPANQGSCILGDVPGNEFKAAPNTTLEEHFMKPTNSFGVTPYLNYDHSTVNPRAPMPAESSVWVRLNGCPAAPAVCGTKTRGGNGIYYDDIPVFKSSLMPLEVQRSAGDDPVVIGNINDPLYPTATLELDINPLRPYLSDNMLVAMINRTPAFSDTYLKDVLKEHSGLSDTVYTALQNNPLPPAMMTEIDAEQSKVSSRSQLDNQIISLKGRMYEAVGNVLKNFQDSLDSDTVDAFLLSHGDLVTEEYKIAMALELGDFTEAQNLLNSYTPITNDEIQLKEILTLKYDLLSNDKNWFEMDSAQLAQVDALASVENDAGMYAKSIQILLGGSIYALPMGSPGSAKRPSEVSSRVERQQTNQTLHIYPNPAQDRVTISLGSPIDEEAYISFYAADGKLMHQTVIGKGISEYPIDVSSLPAGVYLMRIESNTIRSTVKLIVEH